MDALAFLEEKRKKKEDESAGLLALYNMRFGTTAEVTDPEFLEYLELVRAAPSQQQQPDKAARPLGAASAAEGGAGGEGGAATEPPAASALDLKDPDAVAGAFLEAAGMSEVHGNDGKPLPDARRAVQMWEAAGDELRHRLGEFEKVRGARRGWGAARPSNSPSDCTKAAGVGRWPSRVPAQFFSEVLRLMAPRSYPPLPPPPSGSARGGAEAAGQGQKARGRSGPGPLGAQEGQGGGGGLTRPHLSG